MFAVAPLNLYPLTSAMQQFSVEPVTPVPAANPSPRLVYRQVAHPHVALDGEWSPNSTGSSFGPTDRSPNAAAAVPAARRRLSDELMATYSPRGFKPFDSELPPIQPLAPTRPTAAQTAEAAEADRRLWEEAKRIEDARYAPVAPLPADDDDEGGAPVWSLEAELARRAALRDLIQAEEAQRESRAYDEWRALQRKQSELDHIRSRA
eukprot:TRINITY_DN9554_c0_g1_i1.p3 TRINITY_DN9554_c0_g1~~TRINITY_DN9554_c0_g1_i1.p3  ORF type:complete len:215 (+),score=68.95 TRINITY_DN9554_c0_g1_i1:25-645(+)